MLTYARVFGGRSVITDITQRPRTSWYMGLITMSQIRSDRIGAFLWLPVQNEGCWETWLQLFGPAVHPKRANCCHAEWTGVFSSLNTQIAKSILRTEKVNWSIISVGTDLTCTKKKTSHFKINKSVQGKKNVLKKNICQWNKSKCLKTGGKCLKGSPHIYILI